MSVLLSICIVAFYNYKDVMSAVESIEIQTNRSIPFTIYVVDNSPLLSEQEVRSRDDFKFRLANFSNVQYFWDGINRGFGKGHNFVLSRIDSRYHAIVNPDIILQEDAFSKIIKYMKENNDVGMVIPNITDEYGKRQPVYRKEVTIVDMFIRMFCRKLFPKRVSEHTLQDMDYNVPFQVPFGQGSFLVIRTDLFKRLNGFDEEFFMYLEDADLCKRVNQESKLMYYPEASVIHKWEKGSHRDWKLFKYHVASMRYYFQKWGY